MHLIYILKYVHEATSNKFKETNLLDILAYSQCVTEQQSIVSMKAIKTEVISGCTTFLVFFPFNSFAFEANQDKLRPNQNVLEITDHMLCYYLNHS